MTTDNGCYCTGLAIVYLQDLLSGEKFKRKDIIMLQDPQDLSNREIENFEHFRRAKELDQVRCLGCLSHNVVVVIWIP